MMSYWVRVGPRSNESILIRDTKGHMEEGGPCEAKAEIGEAEIGGTELQGQGCLEPPETARGKGGPSPGPVEGGQPCQHLGLGHPVSSAERECT